MAGKTHSGKTKEFLLYGLPRSKSDTSIVRSAWNEHHIVDAPLPSSISFLDFDGTVLFAGAFEAIKQELMFATTYCAHPADQDRRLREVVTLLTSDKPLVFLLPDLPQSASRLHVDDQSDLFRRFMTIMKLRWDALVAPVPVTTVHEPEFREYSNRYGTAYIRLLPPDDSTSFHPLCGSGSLITGATIGKSIFLLPCTIPQTHEDIVEAAKFALASVLLYQVRMCTELPEWVATFAFDTEERLRKELAEVQEKAAALSAELNAYERLKGLLTFQSAPLVSAVAELLSRFFDIRLKVEEKHIDDATLLDEDGNVAAVFEIKGVKGSFTRQHVNQIDSHRERLGLPASVPGILILNSHMSATSVGDKDQSPHPDIIRKACADSVLLVRTLDLLRYADAVERGVLPKEGLKSAMLTEKGWLKVDGDEAKIIGEHGSD